MTKSEYNDLFDQLLYGHDADLNIEGHRFFVEWSDAGITIYQMHEYSGIAIAVLRGEDRAEIVKELFAYPFINGKSLNHSHQEISIIDIE